MRRRRRSTECDELVADQRKIREAGVMKKFVLLDIELIVFEEARLHRALEAAEAVEEREIERRLASCGISERSYHGGVNVGKLICCLLGAPTFDQDQVRSEQVNEVCKVRCVRIAVINQVTSFQARIVQPFFEHVAETHCRSQVNGTEITAKAFVCLVHPRGEVELFLVMLDAQFRMLFIAVHGEGKSVSHNWEEFPEHVVPDIAHVGDVLRRCGAVGIHCRHKGGGKREECEERRGRCKDSEAEGCVEL
mmetsp:Transcript_28939/g.69261  ORF Transcript_28939/g.69261 Transcript_28939/m.69261 type:complete len:250 (-) Transcript_28939:14-763(-)